MEGNTTHISSHQALGGHRSSHNKAAKKILSDDHFVGENVAKEAEFASDVIILDFDLNEVPAIMMEDEGGDANANVNGNGYASSSYNSNMGCSTILSSIQTVIDLFDHGDLWKTCSVYGTVVDVFILSKTSKADDTSLVDRDLSNHAMGKVKDFSSIPKLYTILNDKGFSDVMLSYLGGLWVLFEFNKMATEISKSVYVTNFPESTCARDLWKTCSVYGTVVDVFILSKTSKAGSAISTLCALVLDDTSLVDHDLSNHAMGKVLFEFNKMDTKVNMMNQTCVNSWFQVIQEACNDFVSDERIFWVDIKGVPFNAWSCGTFTRIGKKWGETLDLEDNADTSFGRKRLCVKTKHAVSTLETFKELFSWNPTFLVHKEKEYTSKDESINNKFYPHPNKKEPRNDYASDEDGIPEIVFGSSSSSHKQDNGDKDVTHLEDPVGLYDLLKNKKGYEYFSRHPMESHNVSTGQNVVKNGGSILGIMDDIIRVSQVMGYSMEGCVKDLQNIIGQQGENNVIR
nr:hypothetical protein [Tanacetum cinerariifolium]